MLTDLDTDDPLVCELKIYDAENRGKRHLASGGGHSIAYHLVPSSRSPARATRTLSSTASGTVTRSGGAGNSAKCSPGTRPGSVSPIIGRSACGHTGASGALVVAHTTAGAGACRGIGNGRVTS